MKIIHDFCFITKLKSPASPTDYFGQIWCHNIVIMAPTAENKTLNWATKRLKRRQALKIGGGLRRKVKRRKCLALKRKINVCSDIWLNIFPWFRPVEVGLKLALLSARFDCLVAMHLKTRKWAYGRLSVCSSQNTGGVRVPKCFGDMTIDQLCPPRNVIGFKYIYISYVNGAVLSFLRRLKPLFEMGITLHFTIDFKQTRSLDLLAQQLIPLVGIANITAMYIGQCSPHGICELLKRTSSTFFINCPNLRSIYFKGMDRLIRYGNAPGKNMREWLQTPRGDGRPKVLYRNICTSIIGYYTKDFLAATSPANYIVCFEQYFNGYDPQDFEMDNLRTNERLSLSLVEKKRQNKYCMTRAPIGRNEQQWAQWEREAWREEEKHNLLEFRLEDANIGTDILNYQE